MDRQQVLKYMSAGRAYLLQALDGLTPEQWTTVPEGFSNNILWNAAHIATSQARLLYGLAGLPLPLPEEFVEMSVRGTSPESWTTAFEPREVVATLERIMAQVLEDEQAGKFTTFTPYELKPFSDRPGLTIASFDEAIVFGTFHEGIHIGTIAQLKKLVA